MASRVSVTVNVRDNSRAGIRQVRNAIRRMNDDIRRAGGQADFRVSVNNASVRQARATVTRLTRQLSGQTVRINTRVTPPDRNRFRRMVTNTLTSPARTSGSIVGGIMSDGLGQGIIQGFKTAGPAGMAVLAAIIAGSLSLIGAALSGLLVTALGLAFVGIGGASAAMSDTVKSQWKNTLEGIKSEFRTVGEPLIPVLDRALIRLDQMAHKAGPKLREAIEQTAPATEAFINKILDSFESFGANAFDRIMEAWNVFAPVFGEEWDTFMGDLGEAFGDMATLVKEHPTEIAAALSIVFDILELLIKTVTFFGERWVNMMQGAIDATAFVIKAMADFAITTITALGLISTGAAKALGWIPGLGPKIEGANVAFQSWRDKTVAHLQGVKREADIFSGSLDRANRRRKLEADVRSWRADLTTARADLKKTTDQKARAKLTADIRDLQNKVDMGLRELARINGKVAYAKVITTYEARRTGSHGTELGNAHGGVVGHAATGGIRSNLTMVGEYGPEVVNLPPGSHVRSNPDTRRMMNGGRDTRASQFVFRSSGRRVDDLLLEILREAIHQRGGDPVLVLGG